MTILYFTLVAIVLYVGCDRLLERVEPVDNAVDHEPNREARDASGDLRSASREEVRGDEHLRSAVDEDVGELVDGEARRACGVPRARVMAAPQDLDVARVVLEAERYVVVALHADAAEEVGQAIRSGVELAVGDRLGGRSHHVGGVIGACAEMGSGKHAANRSASQQPFCHSMTKYA